MSPLVAAGYMMSVVVALCGIACLFHPAAEFWFPGWKRYMMGSVLLGYGAFRFYRARHMHNASKQDQTH